MGYYMEQHRALLDQLLGPDRDLPVSKCRKKKINCFDKNVCKYYLAGLCPYHELFKNTKSDLGPCQYKLHDEYFKEQFSSLSNEEKQKYKYDRDLNCKLRDLVK